MPPANQGSKGALVTWTVVATVFGITMAVLALVAYAGQTDAEQLLITERERVSEVVGETDLQGSGVQSLRSQRDAAGATGQKLLPYAINQGIRVTEKAVGGTDPAAAAADGGAIDQKLAQVNAEFQGLEAVSVQPATTLADAVDKSVQAINGLEQRVAAVERERESLRTELEQARQQAQQQQTQLTQQVEQAQEARQQAIATADEARGNVETVAAEFPQQVAVVAEDAARQLNQLVEDNRELQGQNNTLQQQVDRLTAQVQARIGGEQMITQTDGRVIRSPSDNRLTINLGRRQGVARGLTFEIYDSVRGVPKVDGDPVNPANAELPKGKAAIEVIRVGETSSEARVLRTTPGETVREGDVIANLAFDQNSPTRFRVFGDFDLENDGRADARDGERLKNLVTEFGGQVVDEITVDTDVVVLGQQPVLPDFTDEELQNPVNQQILFDAREKLRRYEAVAQQARDLNKTIVNQKQLLYYIGYFEQAQR